EVDCAHREPRLKGPADAGLWFRRASEKQLSIHPDTAIANDVVHVLRGLSATGRIDGHPVGLDDVAILVRRTHFGQMLTERLRAAGIPVAFAGADAAWRSSAAEDWLDLLEAMLEPTRAAVMSVALTDLVGAGITDLVDAGGDAGPRTTRWVLELGRTYE